MLKQAQQWITVLYVCVFIEKDIWQGLTCIKSEYFQV